MTREAQVAEVVQLLHDSKPEHSLDQVRDMSMGIVGTLRFLYSCEQEVKSKDISETLAISSARMTILLKKMERKGLIIKRKSTVDGRSAVITLSAKGKEMCQRAHLQMVETAQMLLDEFGYESLTNLIAQMTKFHTMMHQSMSIFSEEIYD